MLVKPHNRKRPGLNHLAFHAGDHDRVNALTAAAADHGWALMFANKHPHAGGPQTYAANLSNTDGYQVELTGLSEERCVRVRPDPRGDGRG